MSKKKKILISIMIGILIIVLTTSIYVIFYLNKIKGEKLNESKISITSKQDIKENLDKKEQQKMHQTTNILLLGVDNDERASDTMIVLTIDQTDKTIKLSSLMRDSYVDFGPGKITKLNYAYHYGGNELVVKTINEQFKLDIKDYIQVDYGGLTNIINYVGGVNVDVLPEEVKYVNTYSKDIAKVNNIKYTPIYRSGKQKLNGEQATAYCRIRYVGNNDYQRTQRQRMILSKIVNKLMDKHVTEYPSMINELSPYIKTSLDSIEICKLAKNFDSYVEKGIKQTRCPYDGLKTDAMINQIYYMKWDREENIKKLHDFIYLSKEE